MAKTVFYDVNESDERVLRDQFRDTDHHLEFVYDTLNDDTVHANAEVISVFVTSMVTDGLLARMPNLRLIAARSTGFSNIDCHATEARGVSVVTVPSYGEHTVGEYAFALLLGLTRKVQPAVQQVATGVNNPTAIVGSDLSGKTFGIIGTGKIGMHAAHIAAGFSMKVIGYDPYPNEAVAQSVGLNYVGLEELLSQSDVISIHAPYTEDNYHLISSEQIAMMKDGAILVNTGRGELVHTGALIDGLQSGKLRGAALDVVEGEQLLSLDTKLQLLHANPRDESRLDATLALDILTKMPNVIVTHHNAFNTAEAIERINLTTARNIIDYWYGDTPNLVKVQPPTMGKLLLTRHAESEWNVLGKWTGTTDVHLSEKGFREAAMLGELIRDIHVDYAFASQQIRSLETLEGMLDASQQFDVPFKRVKDLNERDYGDYTGLNKWELKEQIGEEAFNGIRRGWDYPVPNGETLKDVFDRAVPFYLDTILPMLRDGKNVMILAHGNTNRSLIKYIESISDEGIADVEMMFGKVITYTVDSSGKMLGKDERSIDSPPPAA